MNFKGVSLSCFELFGVNGGRFIGEWSIPAIDHRGYRGQCRIGRSIRTGL
ncbi:hypothetical protein GCM10023310_64630 [Paenibacillus vulneris]